MIHKLNKTLFFNLSCLAFIFLATPSISVYMHGFAGFSLIISMAVIVGIYEKSLPLVVKNIYSGIKNNIGLFILVILYIVSFVINLVVYGHGMDDWRLMMGPISLLLGFLFAFSFIHNDSCWRYFQIILIITVGIQFLFTFKVIYSDPTIVREMFSDLETPWIHGEPGGFALFAMILPVFLWRSLRESGILKIILLSFCLLIFITISISTFTTPLSLSILNIIIIGVVSAFIPIKNKGHLKGIIIGIMILSIALAGYIFTRDNPILFNYVYSKIDNFIQDPTSGGYAGSNLPVSRWYLAEISIRSFLEDPLWGMGGGSNRYSSFVGGHSSFFDYLGGYGLLGGGGAFCGIILLLLIKAMSKFWAERTWETLLALTSVISLVIGGIINPYWEGLQPIYVLLMARPFIGTSIVKPISNL